MSWCAASEDPAGGDAHLRLALLAARYELAGDAVRQLETFLDLLVGDPHAPTAVREPVGAVDDHFADALVALEVVELRSALAIADIGSGGGVPGLVLAIAMPRADVYLVESSGRKCEFQTRAVAACALANAHVIHARAESWRWGLARFDAVTARAVAPPAVVAEYAAPLLRIGGTLIAWRGRRDGVAEAHAVRAAAHLGLRVVEPVPVQPYPGAERRHLQLMSKVKQTPSGFPRREGLAARRPLGSDRRSGRGGESGARSSDRTRR